MYPQLGQSEVPENRAVFLGRWSQRLPPPPPRNIPVNSNLQTQCLGLNFVDGKLDQRTSKAPVIFL